MSSILSTSSCGEGTHTTSLPDCPTSGVYSTLGAWAEAQTAIADKIRIEKHRLAERHTDMFLLQVVGRKGTRARGTECFLWHGHSRRAGQPRLRARTTSCRRDDGPAALRPSTSAIAREKLGRNVRARPVGGRAASPTSDDRAWSRETSGVVQRRQSEIVEVDPQVAKPPQRRFDDTDIIGGDRIHVHGHVAGFATPVSGPRRIPTGIV